MEKQKDMEKGIKAKVIDAWIEAGNYQSRSIHEIREFAKMMNYSVGYVEQRCVKVIHARRLKEMIESPMPPDSFENEVQHFVYDIEADIKDVDVNELYKLATI